VTVNHTYASAGTYVATLLVSDGHGAVSAPVTKTIQVGNGAPTPTITSPAPGARFAVGQQVTLTGSATDPEQGTLPSSALSWTVIKHHDTHTHPFLGPVSGNNIVITGPAPEDLQATANSYLEIRLTATDAAGASTTVVRNFLPAAVNLTFTTAPTGLGITINGQSFTGPSTITSWQGWALNVSAPDQVLGGRSYRFQRWSDGGARSHTILTPSGPATYSAKFTRGKG